MAILMGSEAHGLSRETIDRCDLKATIPMHHGTDSLNIAIAAAVFLYHFTSPASGGPDRRLV
jgi:tRNA G18 (ribose-2'-O)-methylase SpoU